jgi:hypothetical protein
MSAEMGPPPETEHHHHHHTGHRWLDATLAVSAVFISLISLFLAIQHGRVMEKMVEANTWPFVMVYVSTSNPDATPHVSIHVANKGIGPAKVESLEVFDNGVAQLGTQPLLRAMLKPTDLSRHIPALQSDVVDEVMAPRDDFSILDLDARNFTPQETDLLRSEVAKLTFRVCYCSVFDECSVLDTRKIPIRPVSIKACAVPRTPFQN